MNHAIGELAAIAGVTTRTVRYYHRVGLLPEPDRRLNRYRDYGMRDAVILVRVRRLVELGLSLDEVRDALDDDAGTALTEILTELDADLARQETAIRNRRAALAELLERTRSGAGRRESVRATWSSATPPGKPSSSRSRSPASCVPTSRTSLIAAVP